MTLSSSIWIVALVLAASAPWLVGVLADRFERRVRERTRALIERAKARARAERTEHATRNEG